MSYDAADKAYVNPDTGQVDGIGGVDFDAILTLAIVGRVAKRNNRPPAHTGILNPVCPTWYVNDGIPPNLQAVDFKELSKTCQVSKGTVLRWFGAAGFGDTVAGDCVPLIVCGLDDKGGRAKVAARRFSNIRYPDNVPATDTDDGDPASPTNTKEYRRYLRALLAACLCNSQETLRGNLGPVGIGGIYRAAPDDVKKMMDGTPAIFEQTPYECGTLPEALRYIARCTDLNGYEIDGANHKLAENWCRVWIEPVGLSYPRWRVRIRFTVNPQGSDTKRPTTTVPATDTEGLASAETE